MDFSALKRNRGSLEQATKLLEAAKGNKQQYAKDDERMWYPLTDKAGNGFATIRFLPASPKDGEQGLPWVRKFTHGFQNAGGRWFIDNCPTTLGGNCPVCEFNKGLWNTGIKADKDLASKQKRKVDYFMNVLVISDPATPANNNTMRVFRFGAKIFEKIQTAIKPLFPDQTPFIPYDFWEGANFKLRITKVEGQRNYSQSEFAAPSALAGSDDELQAIWNTQHGLNEFVAPSLFKSYEDLKKGWDRFLSAGSPRAQAPVQDQVAPAAAFHAAATVGQAGGSPTSALVAELEDKPITQHDADDDSELDYFKALVK